MVLFKSKNERENDLERIFLKKKTQMNNIIHIYIYIYIIEREREKE